MLAKRKALRQIKGFEAAANSLNGPVEVLDQYWVKFPLTTQAVEMPIKQHENSRLGVINEGERLIFGQYTSCPCGCNEPSPLRHDDDRSRRLATFHRGYVQISQPKTFDSLAPISLAGRSLYTMFEGYEDFELPNIFEEFNPQQIDAREFLVRPRYLLPGVDSDAYWEDMFETSYYLEGF